jgi:hypothetical protein
MTVKNGLYSIRIKIQDGGRGHATGVIVLLDGKILGRDTHFYYTGSYAFKPGKWRGELITRQHAEALDVILLLEVERSPADSQSVNAFQDCGHNGNGLFKRRDTRGATSLFQAGRG